MEKVLLEEKAGHSVHRLANYFKDLLIHNRIGVRSDFIILNPNKKEISQFGWFKNLVEEFEVTEKIFDYNVIHVENIINENSIATIRFYGTHVNPSLIQRSLILEPVLEADRTYRDLQLPYNDHIQIVKPRSKNEAKLLIGILSHYDVLDSFSFTKDQVIINGREIVYSDHKNNYIILKLGFSNYHFEVMNSNYVNRKTMSYGNFYKYTEDYLLNNYKYKIENGNIQYSRKEG